jgi:plasmid stability protein
MTTEAADRMTEAAVVFLGTLDEAQRSQAAWWFRSDDERRRWFYSPTDHGGLALSSMSPAQQRLAMKLLRTGVSKAGYVTVSTIIGLENVLDELEGWVASWERERGRDPGLYYVRVFGDPAGDQPWSWRFGGHHVSINHTIVDGQVVASTPCFLGADPASSPLLGPHLLRPLGAAEDLGRELVHALRPDQLAQALLSPVAPVDLVTGNRTVVSEGDEPPHLRDIWRRRFTDALAVRVDTMQADAERLLGLQPDHIAALRFTAAPKGISAEELSVEQRELLRALLEVYVHRVPDELADLQLAKFAAERDLDRLSFAWAGGIESGQPHYYRVQGSHLLAEYDNTQRGTNHVHTVWRDLANDFGVDHLAQHYAEHDHH